MHSNCQTYCPSGRLAFWPAIIVLVTLAGCSSTAIDRAAIKSLASQQSLSAQGDRSTSNSQRDAKTLRPRLDGVFADPGQSSSDAVDNVLTNDTFVGLLEIELKRCEDRAAELDLNSNQARNFNIAIAAVGIIAGSIIVPTLAAKAAAKSAIAAWGGVSGAANAAQFTLNANGRSAEATVAVQRAFSERLTTHMAKLKDLATGKDAAAFIYELRMSCSIVAPIANATTQKPT